MVAPAARKAICSRTHRMHVHARNTEGARNADQESALPKRVNEIHGTRTSQFPNRPCSSNRSEEVIDIRIGNRWSLNLVLETFEGEHGLKTNL